MPIKLGARRRRCCVCGSPCSFTGLCRGCHGNTIGKWS